jgi:hypothetical protein
MSCALIFIRFLEGTAGRLQVKLPEKGGVRSEEAMKILSSEGWVPS